MATLAQILKIRKSFNLDSPKLCEFTVSGVKYNDSELVRDVYLFLKDADIFAEIVKFAPIQDTSTALKSYSRLVFFCKGAKQTATSTFTPLFDVIDFGLRASWDAFYRTHIYLHEFMHSLTHKECPEIIGVPINTSAHCRVFKRGLLYSDFLYGILSLEQFSRLEPLVDTFEPNEPYAFEESYERQYLIPTTRNSFQVQRIQTKQIAVSNTKPASINKRVRDFIGAFNDETNLSIPTQELKIRVNEPYETPAEFAELVCQKLKDANLTELFDDAFIEKIKTEIESDLSSIRKYSKNRDRTHPKGVVLTIQIDGSLVDYVEMKALLFRYTFGEGLPNLNNRSVLEAEFKYTHKLPNLFTENEKFDFRLFVHKEKVDFYHTLGKAVNTFIANKVINKEVFDIRINFRTKKQTSSKRLGFDGYFMNTDCVGYFSCRSDDSPYYCFTDELKTDEFAFELDSLSNKYAFALADIEYVIERFTQNVVGDKLKSTNLVNVFDTDILFTNILALIRNDSETQMYETSAIFSSTAQFSSAQEYRDWQTQVPTQALCFVSPNKTYHTYNFFGGTERNILTGIKSYLLTDDFEILGKPIKNRINGFRQSILSDIPFDVSFIAKHIQKGVPFVFAYADSKDALQKDMIFLYFDGQKLAVFEGAKLNSQDMFDLNEVSRLMQQSDLFAIDYLDFGQATLPRPNYAKTAIADDVQALLNNPVATFGDDLIVNLFEVPTNLYANDIVGSLVFRPNLLLKSVIGKKEQMIAVEDKGILRFVYVDKIGRASILDSVYAWWLLAL